MSEVQLTGPDLGRGVPLSALADGGMLAGHADGKPVLLARRGEHIFAVDGACTHYSGPLAEGIMVGETVRCPWHHACFNLRTGEAIKAPALRPLGTWKVETRDGAVFVVGQLDGSAAARLGGLTDRQLGGIPSSRRAAKPSSVVIIGAGAAGDAAADMLRRHGYDGSITMIGAEESGPVDRPNLSKDYLAGNAPEEWIPLRSPEYFAEQKIDLLTDRRVSGLRLGGSAEGDRYVELDGGLRVKFDALLIATGASPVKLPAKIDAAARIMYLRSLADCRAIVARAERATTAVVIGASFIGLEVAASLRARKIAVHVVAPESLPLERILGKELGEFVLRTHQANGVTFHLGRTAGSVGPKTVTLDDGSTIDADLVVAGIGVRPNTELATLAGLEVDNGIMVDAFLETGVPGIFAAGDVARYPDHRTGNRIRVEHWVHAQRMGQCAARNILGAREKFTDVPFFWSAHYGDTIAYVGHAEQWDRVKLDGRLGDKDAAVSYVKDGKTLALATIGRDVESLRAERSMETQGA